jgi:hypothetical protein
MSGYQTVFGSLEKYEKGHVEPISDNVKNYAFSNVFEIASKSRPYEKIVFGQNQQYVLEAIRAEGDSPWYTAAHDEFALVMDNEVEVRFIKLDDPSIVAPTREGTVKLQGTPQGKKMGIVRARRGHMTLLAPGTAYQFHAHRPAVVVLQTIKGENSIERWAEICQSR